jgi:nucleotide-binding universal stress UspA family protein
MSYKRILVPVDGSETAAKGLNAAINLAKESGGRLLLLHVVDEYPAFASPEIGVSVGPILEALRETGRQTLEGIVAGVRNPVVAPESKLVENFGGRVADAIVQEAVDWKADLIVIGTHGRRGVNRALMGSDAEVVVRYSPIPVLLVPPAGRTVPPK